MIDRLNPKKIFRHHPTVESIITKLREKGWRTVIVGGAVRDLLREKLHSDFRLRPSTMDVDIATSAPLDRIKETLKDLELLEIGEKFGVLMAVDPHKKGRTYEIAQFRREENYDGRRPQKVEPADSLKEDLRRRDFTINGMAMEEDGKVIDPVGGRTDLKERKIRAIGDPHRRFLEDHLRSLRAIRFACYIEGKITPPTLQAIKDKAETITDISWERIKEELFKLLETSSSAKGIKLMDQTNLLAYILPELTENKGVSQPEEYHPEGDVFEHSLKALSAADRLNYRPLIKLATLLHDVGKGRARSWNQGEHMGGHEEIGSRISKKIGERLRLSRKEIDRLVWIISNHMRCAKLPAMKKAKRVQLIRYKRDREEKIDDINGRFSHFSDLMRLLLADSQASSHHSEGWLPALKEFTDLLPHLRNLDRRKDARELIDGNDLLEMGLEEGPLVGKILSKLHREIFAGRIESREEALREARHLVKKENGT